MEVYVAVIVGAMTGCSTATAHVALRANFWLDILVGALGGLAGAALWAQSLAATFQDSLLAGTAVAALIGGAAGAVLAAVVIRVVVGRLRAAPRR